ncbi:MAG: disulfide bond formation protein B [Pseudoruegeria sp.]
MTQKQLVLLAAAGSMSLLLGAWGFQALGYAPCKMCIWQRWPHGIAVGLGILFVLLGTRALIALGAISAAATGAIGVYHSGIERGLWEGPSSCTGGGDGLTGLSGADLLSTAGPANIVMCDEVAWSMLGLSMASWNAVFAFGICAVWILALRKPQIK